MQDLLESYRLLPYFVFMNGIVSQDFRSLSLVFSWEKTFLCVSFSFFSWEVFFWFLHNKTTPIGSIIACVALFYLFYLMLSGCLVLLSVYYRLLHDRGLVSMGSIGAFAPMVYKIQSMHLLTNVTVQLMDALAYWPLPIKTC